MLPWGACYENSVSRVSVAHIAMGALERRDERLAKLEER
jgi:hypothetical protein